MDIEIRPEEWTELFQLMNKKYPDYYSQFDAITKEALKRGFGGAWNDFKECILDTIGD